MITHTNIDGSHEQKNTRYVVATIVAITLTCGLIGSRLIAQVSESGSTIETGTGTSIDVVEMSSGSTVELSSSSADTETGSVIAVSGSILELSSSSEHSETGSVITVSGSSVSSEELSSESTSSESAASEELSSASFEESSSSSEAVSSSSAVTAELVDVVRAAMLQDNIAPNFQIPKDRGITNMVELEKRLTMSVIDGSGDVLPTHYDLTEQSGSYLLHLEPLASTFRPGQYAVELVLDATRGITRGAQRLYRTLVGEQSDAVLYEQAFDWGTVAIVTDKDSYQPGDEAQVSIALVGNDGAFDCASPVSVDIENPSGEIRSFSVNDDTLHLPAFCGEDVSASASSGSDITVRFPVTDVGDYRIAFVHASLSGSIVTTRAAVGSFSETPRLSVRRTSPVAVDAGAETEMAVTVVSNVDFIGSISETLPSGFTVTQVPAAVNIENVGDAVRLTWSGRLTGGVGMTLRYTYRAPSDAPLFALFDPLVARGTFALEDDISIGSVSSSSQSSDSFESSESFEFSSDASSLVSSGAWLDESSSVSSASGDVIVDDNATIDVETAEVEVIPAQEPVVEDPVVEEPQAGIWQRLLGFFGVDSVVAQDASIGEETLNEAARFQVLVTVPRINNTVSFSDGTLVFERTQQVFDANQSPEFTLVDVEIPHNSETLEANGDLRANIAIGEVLRAVIDESDVRQALVEHEVRANAAIIDDAVLDVNGADTLVAEALLQDRGIDHAAAALSTVEAEDAFVQHIANEAAEQLRADETMMMDRGTVSDAVDAAVETTSRQVQRDLSRLVAQRLENSDVTQERVEEALHAASDAPATVSTPLLQLTLTGPRGTRIENPSFRFVPGSVVLVLDPITGFVPGVYTLTIHVTNPLTGDVQILTQQFAWGVLAINADKDTYRSGETARIDFGVLDDRGEIVCDASLTLIVAAPDGTSRELSTDDGTIEQTQSCAKKESGFIDPDFTSALVLEQIGTYQLTLRATTVNGTRELPSSIRVEDSPPFVIGRTAATRLWPFASSPMDITVQCGRAMNGGFTDTLPVGFTIDNLEPNGGVYLQEDGTTKVQWKAECEAGETLNFHYDYDAPDISPYFYLIGPLEIGSDTPLTDS